MFVISYVVSSDDFFPNNATVSFDEGMSRIPFKSLDYTVHTRSLITHLYIGTAPLDTLYRTETTDGRPDTDGTETKSVLAAILSLQCPFVLRLQ